MGDLWSFFSKHPQMEFVLPAFVGSEHISGGHAASSFGEGDIPDPPLQMQLPVRAASRHKSRREQQRGAALS